MTGLSLTFGGIEPVRDKGMIDMLYHRHPAGHISWDVEPNDATIAWLGWMVRSEYRKKGIGKKAVTVLIDHLAQMYRYETYAVMIRPTNEASFALAESTGFHFSHLAPGDNVIMIKVVELDSPGET